MHKTKLFVNGKRLKDVYVGATKWQVFKYRVMVWFRRLVLLSILGGIGWFVFTMGSLLNPSVVYTKAEVIKEVPIKAPILEKIFVCESGGKHFDKNGQVLMRSNTNRTVDIGIAQINTVWFAKATELGYDLTIEKDNRAMAQWIYENRGTEDWSASKKCWR
jgi:hypothetical protein